MSALAGKQCPPSLISLEPSEQTQLDCHITERPGQGQHEPAESTTVTLTPWTFHPWSSVALTQFINNHTEGFAAAFVTCFKAQNKNHDSGK